MSLYATICISLICLNILHRYMIFNCQYPNSKHLREVILLSSLATVMVVTHISGDYFEVALFGALFFITNSIVNLIVDAFCVWIVSKISYTQVVKVEILNTFLIAASVPVILYITLFFFEVIS